MKVATRLNLAILPAIVGLAVVAALAYWGVRGRQAPELIVGLALLATLGSALLSWRSTRFVSRRVGELASEFRAIGLALPPETSGDEFEELVRVRDSVRVLAEERQMDRERSAAIVRKAESDRKTHDVLLESIATTISSQLEDARLALHILQTSPFGELNENQEELVSAARQASEDADRDLRRFKRLMSLSSAQRDATRESIPLPLLLEPSLAIAGARAQERGISLSVISDRNLAPAFVERVSAQEAMSLIFTALIETLSSGADVRVTSGEFPGEIALRIEPGFRDVHTPSLLLMLAAALLEAQSVRLTIAADAITARFPMPPARVWHTSAAHSVQH